MRILFAIDSLKGGGAERVVSRLANYWVANGHEVAIATIFNRTHDAYPLDKKIKRFYNDIYGSKNRWERRWQHLKRKLSLYKNIQSYRPDITVSFIAEMNIQCLSLKRFVSCPIIVSERSNPDRKKIKPRDEISRRRLYPSADKLVLVSAGVSARYDWLPAEKRVVIYNPLEDVPEPEDPITRKTSIINVARLHPVKGHEALIEAFAKLSPEHPLWTLDIYGDGTLRSSLEEKISAHGLKDKITLHGFEKNVPGKLRQAGIFAFSSLHEGFPNALIEAMACGVPVVSFDCDYGPREVIEHGVTGLLAKQGDSDDLAAKLRLLIENEELRARLARNALQTIRKLSIENISNEWMTMFTELLNRSSENFNRNQAAGNYRHTQANSGDGRS